VAPEAVQEIEGAVSAERGDQRPLLRQQAEAQWSPRTSEVVDCAPAQRIRRGSWQVFDGERVYVVPVGKPSQKRQERRDDLYPSTRVQAATHDDRHPHHAAPSRARRRRAMSA
ncbi:MAG: hypothetical protein OEW19_23105, partial [Acidobacteriota bacterium]|nr:hypothetical protein [Acidobacteriota bacterium]